MPQNYDVKKVLGNRLTSHGMKGLRTGEVGVLEAVHADGHGRAHSTAAPHQLRHWPAPLLYAL